MAETDAECRVVEVAEDGYRDTGVGRCSRAGRDDDAIRVDVTDIIGRKRVVAVDDHVVGELAHVLHEIVGERVVVVDDEDAGHWSVSTDWSASTPTVIFAQSPSASLIAVTRARAFASVSSYSRSGSESWTMPAPTRRWYSSRKRTSVRMMMFSTARSSNPMANMLPV
ncbi:hypothetical protein HFX_0668 [Haloferax mediterranei ATCC 33500]|uniref:Uncharacterized protein n=1 Tax=Haloferax mediterranei (strain ATCC 33500 / DSM 1411 / JCM 8866 / NBRC 14739 / NCIMB 2177 / R-4) TaxID=523841 RepID=I3R2D2_HALMT|nr:hypothetical protein HFX_0668 [Haloferax mediterranei ATCC 33500]